MHPARAGRERVGVRSCPQRLGTRMATRSRPRCLRLCDRYRISVPSVPNYPYNQSRKIVLLVRTFDTAQLIPLNVICELACSYGWLGWSYT